MKNMENLETNGQVEKKGEKFSDAEIKNLISSSITLKICGDLGIKDNTNAMRVNIFAMDLTRLFYENLESEDEILLLEMIKNSSGYKGIQYDIGSFKDEAIKGFIKQAKEIKEYWENKNKE